MPRKLACSMVVAFLAAAPARPAEDSWPEIIGDLLEFPAPLADWQQHAPFREKPPPDDAPFELLAAWWGRASESDGPRPSPRVQERFLRALEENPGENGGLASWLPRTPETRAAVERAFRKSGVRMPESSRDSLSRWLEETKALSDELLPRAAAGARYAGGFTVSGEEALRTLLRRDRTRGREVLPVEIPAADTLDAVAWVPARGRVLVHRAARSAEIPESQAEAMEARLLEAMNHPRRPQPEESEYYLCDPATGAAERVEGRFEPWFHMESHPLQPTGRPNEVWVAIPLEKETVVGRYDTGAFTFTAAGKLPRLRFTSDDLWVHAEKSLLYVVKNGDLIALPIPR